MIFAGAAGGVEVGEAGARAGAAVAGAAVVGAGAAAAASDTMRGVSNIAEA
jgi:hypothetical protein